MRKIADKSKKPRKKIVLLNIAIAVCALIVLGCGAVLLASQLEYRKGDEMMQGITQYAGFVGAHDQSEEPEFVVDYDALLAINPDFVGWLYSEGTVINYPVVQGEDNDYYLTHVFEGQEHKYGSIFLDQGNSPDFSDANTLVHGHRMNSGAMFGSLVEYAKQEYYEQHKALMLYTKSQSYRLEVFAAYEVPAKVESLPLRFASEADYQDYLNAAYEKSSIQTDVAVGTGDRIVSLSTCTKTDSQKRFVVQAKLVPVS